MKSPLVRVLAAAAVVTLLGTSCGGADESSSRTRNSVACFDTQDDKDAAIVAAQAKVDQVMSGSGSLTPTDGSDSSTSTSVESEESTDSSSTTLEGSETDSSTSTSVESTSTTIASSTTVRSTTTTLPVLLVPPSPSLEEASGSGGYIRPARLVRNGDDTSSTVAEPQTGELTDEQQMALNLLEVTKATPLCSEISDGIAYEEENTNDLIVTCRAVLLASLVPSETGAECDGPLPYELAIHSFAATDDSGIATYQWYYNGEPIFDSSSWDTDIYPSIAPEVQFSGDLLDEFLGDPQEESPDGPFVTCSVTMTRSDVASTCRVPLVLFVVATFMDGPAEMLPSNYTGAENVSVIFGDKAENMAGYRVIACLEADVDVCYFEDGFSEVDFAVESGPRTESFEVPCPRCEERWTQGSVPSGLGFAFFTNDGYESVLEFAAPGTCDENELEIRIWSARPQGLEYEDTSKGFPYEWDLTLEIPDEELVTSTISSDESSTSIDSESQRPDYCAATFYAHESDLYVAVIRSNTESVWYSSNITEITDPGQEFFNPPSIDDPFVYDVESSVDYFVFDVEDESPLSLIATSGQSCPDADPDDKGDGYIDPEIELYQVDATLQLVPFAPSSLPDDRLYRADNNLHGLGETCSGAYLDVVVEPGRYVVGIENDDYGAVSDRGTITVQSSVELAKVDLVSLADFDMRSLVGVIAPSTLFLDVPSGGGLVAITVEPVSEECIASDDPIVELWASEDNEYLMSSDQDGELYGLKCNSSAIVTFLDEGSYELRVYQYEENEGPQIDGFTVSVGFYASKPETAEAVQVTASQDPPPPSVAVSQNEKFPVEAVVSSSDAAVIIDEGVETMVCKADCIDTLFALEGVVGDTLVIDAGGEPVTVNRTDRTVVVPVGADVATLAVLQQDAAGVTRQVWSADVVSVPRGFDPAAATITSYSRGGGRELLIILAGAIILAILGGGVSLLRTRRSA